MKSFECQGSPDFELNEQFDRKVKYHVSEPEKNSKGIIFFIACFGLTVEYCQKFIKRISTELGYTGIFVEYHCFQARPENGATILFEPEEIKRMVDICNKYKVTLKNKESIQEDIFREMGRQIKEEVTLKAILTPTNGDYQNFGLMQALDHIYVIDDLIKRGSRTSNIILFGSSHGGYIAHMVAKLAPNTIRLIIDNSSYISPPPNYLGIGPEYKIKYDKIIIACSVFSKWQRQIAYAPNYYGIGNHLIRDVANSEHLEIISRYTTRPVKVRAFQWDGEDYISHPEDKEHQEQQYQENGFDYELNLVKRADDAIFRKLEHGLDADLFKLLKNALAIEAPVMINVLDFGKTEMVFPCYSSVYFVDYTSDLPVKIEIERLRYY